MNIKEKVARMLGEFLRESAVLIAVFVPLVRLVEQEQPLTFWWLFITLVLSGGLLTAGILVEVVISE